MNFIELQTVLQKLTDKKITQADFARILNVGRANISDRNKRNSQVNTQELELIQNALNIKYYHKADDTNFFIKSNSKNRCFNPDMKIKRETIGKKVLEIQSKNNLSNIQMAGLLNISEQELDTITSGKTLPNLSILDNLSQNFDISIDWFLHG